MRAEVAEALALALGAVVEMTSSVSGGDISESSRVGLDDGETVFVKTHDTPPPGFFAAEADGLTRLASTCSVRVPEVLAVSDDAGRAFLAMEWIEQRATAADHDECLGRSLAALHAAPCDGFGLERHNFIGTVVQDNTPTSTWPEFFATRRLVPLFRAALDRGALPHEATTVFQRVLDRLPDLVGPTEPPSLLHGDLWGGNAITDVDGRPVLIDPAVHGGHREIDLAMMRLFGGFSPRTFAAYEEASPLADGHRDRVRLYQLPPVLVHAILFGGGYGATVVDILRSYA